MDVSFRFAARDTVPVNKLRYFHAVSKEKPGYSGGTGGRVLISLQTDSGWPHHRPSGFVLASAIVEQPLEKPSQNLVRFGETAVLEKGKIYHIVFENGALEPQRNFVSVNTMAVMTPRERVVPPEDEVDMRVLIRSNGGSWGLFHAERTVTPIFSLFYELSRERMDGLAVAGYGGMESWVGEPRRIAGQEMVRQVFTPLRDGEVRSVNVRMAKRGNPGPLWVTLEELTNLKTGTQRRRGKTSIPAEEVPWVDLAIGKPYRMGHRWVRGEFATPIALKGGVPYAVSFNTDAEGGAYETFPLRDGEEFGYAAVWPNAWAEYTTTGEKGWRGWDAWGKSNLKSGDLQLFLG